jgi:rubredoxin
MLITCGLCGHEAPEDDFTLLRDVGQEWVCPECGFELFVALELGPDELFEKMR